MHSQKNPVPTKRRWPSALAVIGALLVSLFVTVGAAPSAHAAEGNILPPFDIGQSWNICQGYNTGHTHKGTSAYGIDLTGAGCDNSAAGRNVRAPLGGTVYYYQASVGNLCVNVPGGRSYTLTHINSGITSGSVTAGQLVGTVAAPGARGNGNVAHIHFQMWATPNCYSSSGIPFDSAHGARICGAPNLTSSGPSSGNGTWSGTSFVGAGCGGTSPSDAWKSRTDVDGNLGADLVVTTKEAAGFKSFALLSTYEQFLQPQLWLDGSGYGWDGVTPLAGDINGDGKSDYVFLTREASGTKAFVSRSTGGGFQAPQLWWDGSGYGYDGVKATLADVDGNRGADLVITTKEAAGFKSFALLSTYEQFLQPQLWLDGSGYGWDGVTPLAADINGDGKSDYIFLTQEATGTKAFVSRSTGGGFQAPQLWWNGTDYGYSGLKAVMGDADGNGGADLIITTKEAGGSSKGFVLLSTYEQFLQPQLWLDGSGYGWDGVTPLAGDVNGDNKADFVFLTHEASGHTKAFTAKSSGSGFYPPQLWWDGSDYGYEGVKAVLR